MKENLNVFEKFKARVLANPRTRRVYENMEQVLQKESLEKNAKSVEIIEGVGRRATQEELDVLIPFSQKFDRKLSENVQKRYKAVKAKKQEEETQRQKNLSLEDVLVKNSRNLDNLISLKKLKNQDIGDIVGEIVLENNQVVFKPTHIVLENGTKLKIENNQVTKLNQSVLKKLYQEKK